MSEAPYDVVDPVEGDDLSGQTGQELLEAVRKIRFSVKEAKLQEVEEKASGTVLMKKLNIQAKIGPLGVDGNGKYAGKILFGELIVWFNKDRYTSEWWQKQSRFPYKSYLQATGQSISPSPTINDEWLEAQKDKEFIADITVKTIQKKVDGEYVDTDQKKNELANFKRVE